MEILIFVIGLLVGLVVGVLVTFYAFRAYQMKMMKQMMQGSRGGQPDLSVLFSELEKMMKP